MSRDFLPYLLVAIGGALGALSRFAITQLLPSAGGGKFPVGTFTVNVVGSFLLGILGTYLHEKLGTTDTALHYALAVGFLGSLTTFSTFAFEKNALYEAGRLDMGLAYLAATVIAGLLMVRLGVTLARYLFNLS